MPLNKVQLQADIKAAFDAQKSKKENQDAALEDISSRLATAIDNYVKSMTVTSIPVLSSPSGPVTGQINNSVS